jgi:hypothetical protein
MAEQQYVVVYAATYPTVAAARAVLDTIEHLHQEVASKYDAAVVDKENGKAHVVKGWTIRTSASSPSGSAAVP